MYERPKLTEEDGHRALRGHVVDKALLARARYGPEFGPERVLELLADPDLVRFPTRLEFTETELRPGEFAHAQVSAQGPRAGFTLYVHREFERRPELLSLLVAYHVPSINYLDIAGPEEAELFGATLHGLDVEDYYRILCELVDGMAGPKGPELTAELALLLEPSLQHARSGEVSTGAPGRGRHGCGEGCGC
ncbi:MAG: hypothetical protein H6828_01235 [Planctomycetes bacterium]|nr:hypothetical protein [Planctomycetota bacterium]